MTKEQIEKDVAYIFEVSGIALKSREHKLAFEVNGAMQRLVDYISKRTNWVSVENRVPDMIPECTRSKECIVKFDDGSIDKAYYDGDYERWCPFDDEASSRIKYWMEMPETT